MFLGGDHAVPREAVLKCGGYDGMCAMGARGCGRTDPQKALSYYCSRPAMLSKYADSLKGKYLFIESDSVGVKICNRL